MTKEMANRILQLRNDMTVSRFWNDVIPEYLSIDDDGYIHMNCDICPTVAPFKEGIPCREFHI